MPVEHSTVERSTCDNSSHQGCNELSGQCNTFVCCGHKCQGQQSTWHRRKSRQLPPHKQIWLIGMLLSADHAANSMQFFLKSIREIIKSGKRSLRPPGSSLTLSEEFSSQTTVAMSIKSPFSFRASQEHGLGQEGCVEITKSLCSSSSATHERDPGFRLGCDWGCGKAEPTPRPL